MADPTSSSPRDPVTVPWADVVRFVRQLSHDLRNHLNAAELQSVFLNELATDAEMKSEIKRLREMLAQLGSALQKLSAALAPPKANLLSYRAGDLVEDIRLKLEREFPDRKAAVQWEVEVGEAMVEVDPQLFQQAVFELLDNAFRHGTKENKVNVSARVDGSQFILQLRETKTQFDSPTENWGREPLHRVGQGHYGLGLHRVHAIAEANHGEFRAEYNSAESALVSTIVLPVSRAGS